MAKRHCSALPVFPADEIGPKMRPGLAQTGTWRDRFVIRSNPIGALYDALRSFCSPMPMTEDGDDGYVAEDPTASTGEHASFIDDPGEGYNGWGGAPPAGGELFGNPQFGPPGYGNSCGPGTSWDAALQQCVLPAAPAAREDTAGSGAAAAARSRLAAARASGNCEEMRQILDLARSNQGKNQKAAQYLRWHPIAASAYAWLQSNAKRCRI